MTVHPTVVYYYRDHSGEIKWESHVFISNDICHDYHNVNNFFEESIATLQTIMAISRIVIFSDGCGAQYKSRGAVGRPQPPNPAH